MKISELPQKQVDDSFIAYIDEQDLNQPIWVIFKNMHERIQKLEEELKHIKNEN